jgi:type IV secretion system protein VirD4
MKAHSSLKRPKEGSPDAGVTKRAAWIATLLLLAFAAVKMPCIAVCVVIFLICCITARRATSTAYGSARLASYEDLQAGLLGSRGLILGRAIGKKASVFRALLKLFTAPFTESKAASDYMICALFGLPEPEAPLIRLRRFVHLLAVAPPGGGIVIPNLLTHPGSVVAIDPKGELFKTTSRVRRRHLGNRIVRLDPLGVCGPGGSRLNPLDFVDPKSQLVIEQCSALAEALVVQTGTEADPHWNESAKLALTGALLYVVVYAAPADRTLNAVADLLTDPDSFGGMVAMMRDQTGDLAASTGHTPAYRLLQRFGNTMAAWQDRELSSILSSAGRHLSWLHSQSVEEHLSESDFDPRDLVRDDVTVYLVLPPKYLSALSRLLRLWVTTLYGAITESGPQEEREVLFMLDEAGNLGPMPSLYQALTLGRGYGVRCWLILQSIGQLKTLFPKDGEHQTAEASIDHRIFFGVRDHATAEQLSNYIGTATVAVTSESSNRGSSQSGSLAGMLAGEEKNYSRSTNSGTSETRSEVGRKLMMPDEILQLPADSVVILAKNVPPILAKLAKFYECPELADVMPDVPAVK